MRKNWRPITPEYNEKLYKSFPQQMAALIQPKRAHTNYSWFCNCFISVLMTLNTILLQGGRFFFSKMVCHLSNCILCSVALVRCWYSLHCKMWINWLSLRVRRAGVQSVEKYFSLCLLCLWWEIDSNISSNFLQLHLWCHNLLFVIVSKKYRWYLS